MNNGNGPTNATRKMQDLPDFYVAGGTLSRSAPSYVERQADIDLYQWLRAREYCYVLTSRQMGKSSLMVRTASRLRQQAGIAVASIDLTAFGQNLTPEQWYGGMLRRIGRQLDLEDPIDDYWSQHKNLGPLQRWVATLGELVLKVCHEDLVIFVDEIDAVRSLPFPADEFFAGIRECYNRRASDPDFKRITFCLLGVATPSQLIDDPHLTPFNVGHRVELRDFLPKEAFPLAGALLPPSLIGPTEQVSADLLRRILYWTGGHPYLTQRFCQAVATLRSARGAADIDRIANDVFLGRSAQEKNDNLLLVRDSLLRSTQNESELSDLLRLYADIRAGKRIEDDSADPVISCLRLSGITKVEQGILQVRNRIYRHVFDRDWVTANLPGAELRRHRASYQAGVRRTLVYSGLVLAVVTTLAGVAIYQAKLATERAAVQKRLLLWSDIKIAEQALEQHKVFEATRMLAAHHADSSQNFVYRYLWKQCHEEIRTIRRPGQKMLSATYSPDGQQIALGDNQGRIHLWDARTGAEQSVFTTGFRKVVDITYAPDGKRIAVILPKIPATKSSIQVWFCHSGTQLRSLQLPYMATSLRFSPDGASLETNGNKQKSRFWSLTEGREKIPPFPALRCMEAGDIQSFAFSPDRQLLALSRVDKPTQIIDVASGRALSPIGDLQTVPTALAFSPDSRLLAAGASDGSLRLWETRSGKAIAVLQGHINLITGIAFSPDGKNIVTASRDGTVKIWNPHAVKTNRGTNLFQSVSLQGFVPRLQTSFFALSPDGHSVAANFSRESTLTTWELTQGKRQSEFDFGSRQLVWSRFQPDSRHLTAKCYTVPFQVFDTRSGMEVGGVPENEAPGKGPLTYSPDGQWLVTGDNQKAFVQNLKNNRRSFLLDIKKVYPKTKKVNHVVSAAFSLDGRLLATGSWDGKTRLWDVATQRLRLTLGEGSQTVNAIAFAPDGLILATAGEEGVIRFWDTILGREIFTLDTGLDRLTAIVFTPDGSTLKAAFANGTVRSWTAAPETEIEQWIADTKSDEPSAPPAASRP